MPLGDLRGLGPGSLIHVVRDSATIKVGNNLLGRVIDAMEIPHDGLPAPLLTEEKLLYSHPPGPMQRKNITETLDLGIRAINGLITCGTGQRMGIMAGSGIGKSVLLGMMARYARADINVIALIGERGREVREFIERDLGKEGLARSVIVVVTSDQSPLAADARCLCRHRHCRIFLRTGQKCPPDDGFRDPFCHGHARDRPGHR